jgi:hypothetical protein
LRKVLLLIARLASIISGTPGDACSDPSKRQGRVLRLYTSCVSMPDLYGAINWRDDMRYLVVAAVMALGVGVFGVGGASAAPANGQAISQNAEQASSLAKIAGGCGHGWHRNRWGHCVP